MVPMASEVGANKGGGGVGIVVTYEAYGVGRGGGVHKSI